MIFSILAFISSFGNELNSARDSLSSHVECLRIVSEWRVALRGVNSSWAFRFCLSELLSRFPNIPQVVAEKPQDRKGKTQVHQFRLYLGRWLTARIKRWAKSLWGRAQKVPKAPSYGRCIHSYHPCQLQSGRQKRARVIPYL